MDIRMRKVGGLRIQGRTMSMWAWA